MYAQMCMWVYVSVHDGRQSSSSGITLYCFPPYFWRQSLSLNLEFTNRLAWLLYICWVVKTAGQAFSWQSHLPRLEERILEMSTSASDYQNSGTVAATAAVHAHCATPGAHSFLLPDTGGNTDSATCRTGPKQDLKRSGAERHLLTDNLSAPATPPPPQSDSDCRLGLLTRDKCRSTPVL